MSCKSLHSRNINYFEERFGKAPGGEFKVYVFHYWYTLMGKAGIREGSENISVNDTPLPGKTYFEIVTLMVQPAGTTSQIMLKEPEGFVNTMEIAY